MRIREGRLKAFRTRCNAGAAPATVGGEQGWKGSGRTEAELPQVVQLLVGEAQRAQRLDLALDVVDERHQVHALVAALEAVLHLCPGEVMQHHLHHRELVQVGIE